MPCIIKKRFRDIFSQCMFSYQVFRTKRSFSSCGGMIKPMLLKIDFLVSNARAEYIVSPISHSCIK